MESPKSAIKTREYDAVTLAASMPKVPLRQLEQLIAYRNLLAVDIQQTPSSLEDLYAMKVQMLEAVNTNIRLLLAVEPF